MSRQMVSNIELINQLCGEIGQLRKEGELTPASNERVQVTLDGVTNLRIQMILDGVTNPVSYTHLTLPTTPYV